MLVLAASAATSTCQQEKMMSLRVIQVPDFNGMTLDAAKSAAIDPMTHKPMFSAITANDMANGTVSKQDPVAGSTVPLGSRPLSLTLKGPSIIDTILQGLVDKKPSKVKVPSLIGDSATEATSALTKYKLTASFANGTSGVVFQQSIAAGTLVDPGTTITVALKVPAVSVPNLVGLDLSTAEAHLGDASLQIGRVNAGKATDANPERAVVAQTPPANASVPPDSAVDVTLGPPPQVIIPSVEIRVPNLLGLNLARAEAVLAKNSLRPGTISGPALADSKVVLQQPLAGKSARVNDAVDVTLRATSVTVTVPDLSGETEVEAQTTLISKGLLLGNVDGSKTSVVKGQLPVANSTLPRGSSVSITMVSRPSYLLLAIVGLALLGTAAATIKAVVVHRFTLESHKSVASITAERDPQALFTITMSDNNLARHYRVESEPALERKR